MSQVVIIKVPSGSQAPSGYQLVKTLRGIDIYHKMINKVTVDEINDLDNLFNNLGLNSNDNVAIVPAINEDAFLDSLNESMQGLQMGGKRRRKVSKSRKGRKSRKGHKSRRGRK